MDAPSGYPGRIVEGGPYGVGQRVPRRRECLAVTGNHLVLDRAPARTVWQSLRLLDALGVISRKRRSRGRGGRSSDMISLNVHREFELTPRCHPAGQDCHPGHHDVLGPIGSCNSQILRVQLATVANE